jgi:hypothetical protein
MGSADTPACIVDSSKTTGSIKTGNNLFMDGPCYQYSG